MRMRLVRHTDGYTVLVRKSDWQRDLDVERRIILKWILKK
jgi:hypothetical protein